MKVSIIGGGESGVWAAILAKEKGCEVFLSDSASISEERKDLLNKSKIEFEEGKHSMEILEASHVIVKSPGIPNESVVIKELKSRRKRVVGEIEFAFDFFDGRIIGVTGSNGKSTVSSLIHHCMTMAGLPVGLGGNIGESFSSVIAWGKKYTWMVLELSSFQLEDIDQFRPDIAIQLNITADHLDRYEGSIEKYAAAKFRLHMNQKENDILIYNEDNDMLKYACALCVANKSAVPFWDAKTMLKDKFEIEPHQLKIQGEHNVFNALISGIACEKAGLEKEKIKQGLLSFEAIPHRLESVVVRNGIEYINDSKGTNVDAVRFAFSAMKNPTIWIVGGVDKGNDYSMLDQDVKEKVKAFVFLGTDNQKLINYFGDTGKPWKEANSMREAIESAESFAEVGDVILLSPACASFDLFKNYIDRGNQFKELLT